MRDRLARCAALAAILAALAAGCGGNGSDPFTEPEAPTGPTGPPAPEPPSEPLPLLAPSPCRDARVAAASMPFTPEALRARRAAVLEAIPASVAIWPGAADMGWTEGEPERPESDFHYLAGLGPGDVWLVLARTPAGRVETFLYVDTAAVPGAGSGRAADLTGVGDVRCLADAAAEIPDLLAATAEPGAAGRILLAHSIFAGLDRTVLPALDTTGLEVGRADDHVLPLRPAKDAEEIERLRRAARITAAGLAAALGAIGPDILEGDLEAVIETVFADSGAVRRSFPSIVASGGNAIQWHYSRNDDPLDAGELVVVDVGAEFGRYAGDVTRTLPVSGTFTDRQRALYELVLGAKQAAVEAAGPGVTLQELETIARDRMDELDEAAGNLCPDLPCSAYFGHRLSHGVGLDVHDPLPSYVPLEPGMVFTIEPGLYISGEGVGIRIEDDYLVTETGVELLSAGLPETVEEIEAALARP
ncbi:MAG: Xaa-Pro peptidase family protein [Gemmatimonadota bacterium]|nr:Xaa-Pro peptidase family protein [Gemmatimonadota bacterium]